ncbi:MAG: DedA family protein [Calditrichales bacterium]|nr:MAG: DedA family protein [Calditrichales bacterium]
MIEFLESIFSQISPAVAYIILAVSAFTENVLPPVPGDTVVVLGAYLVSTGQLSFLGVYISTTLGSVAGFVTMYFIGLYFGRSFIYQKFRGKLFKESQVKKVEVWFGKWGYGVIFANRFLSGTRSVISLFAGLFHLRAILVIGLSLLSAAIWNGILIIAGMTLGDHWGDIMELVGRYNKVLIGLTLIALSFVIYRKFIRKKSAKIDPDPGE